MAGHEILTIQLGHLSNFVGAHYWNQQDEYFAQVRRRPCGGACGARLRPDDLSFGVANASRRRMGR